MFIIKPSTMTWTLKAARQRNAHKVSFGKIPTSQNRIQRLQSSRSSGSSSTFPIRCRQMGHDEDMVHLMRCLAGWMSVAKVQTPNMSDSNRNYRYKRWLRCSYVQMFLLFVPLLYLMAWISVLLQHFGLNEEKETFPEEKNKNVVEWRWKQQLGSWMDFGSSFIL